MKLYNNKDIELQEPKDVFISQKLTNYSRTTSLNKQELADSSMGLSTEEVARSIYIVQLASTKKKFVQINDKSMKLCYNTYDPKTDIFWYGADSK